MCMRAGYLTLQRLAKRTTNTCSTTTFSIWQTRRPTPICACTKPTSDPVERAVGGCTLVKTLSLEACQGSKYHRTQSEFHVLSVETTSSGSKALQWPAVCSWESTYSTQIGKAGAKRVVGHAPSI